MRPRHRAARPIVAALVLAVAGALAVVGVAPAPGSQGAPPAVSAPGHDACPSAEADPLPGRPATAVPSSVGSWQGTQLENARSIIDAGADRQVSARAQAVAVMAAMGQGLRSARIDPRHDPAAFYAELAKLKGWEHLPPSTAAHRVLGNADPHAFERYWQDAVEVLGALTGTDATQALLRGGSAACDLPETGRARPTAYPLPPSLLPEPAEPASLRDQIEHPGALLPAACGTPVYAAHAGTVKVRRGQDWSGPWLVTVSTGRKGLTTDYAHLATVSVRTGEEVEPGERLGTVGAEGVAQECLLRFTVRAGRMTADAAAWLKQVAGAPVAVRLAHANIYSREPDRQYAADLARILSTKPDFITLNETYFRSEAQLSPPGYAHYRARGPFDAREAPVLWRKKDWTLLDSGTELMHRWKVKLGTRYVNWVTLRDEYGRVVSVISGHASPPAPYRGGMLKAFVRRLNQLVDQLARRGDVLVGIDMNAHYPSPRYPRSLLARSRTVSTFDLLGRPPNGFVTGAHTGIIDYILLRRGGSLVAVSHNTADLPYSNHRMVYADFVFTQPAVPTG